MRDFDDMINKLQQNDEVPQQIWDRLDEVMGNLPDYNDQDSKVWMKKNGKVLKMDAGGGSVKKPNLWKKAAAVAAVLVVAFMVCYSNPVLASRIPLLSKIFEKIENDIPFSGNYSQKAEQLTSSDSEMTESKADGSVKETGNVEESVITASDNDITITASEVYCDGLSVFLSAQVYVQQGGLENVLSHYVKNNDARSDALYLRGDWKLTGEKESHTLIANFMEGKVIDNHTFAGMVKLDLNTVNMEQDTLELQLSSIGWDDITIDNADDISETCQIDGKWNLTVPFHADKDSLKEIEVNQEQDGYAVRKVFVTPYQVVSYIDAPVTQIEKNISRTDYEEKLGLKEGEEDPDLSYEQYMKLQATKIQPCETVICNQNGELLPMWDMSTTSGTTTFAVNEKEISRLHIFVFTDYEDYEKTDGTIDMESAAKRAVVSAEIVVN